jgi:hypothetical protein
MTIPNFKNKEDCDVFLKMFEDRLAVKVAMLNRVKGELYPGFEWGVKGELYPGFEWASLPPSSLETINDIVQSLLYDVEYTFKASYPDYKDEEDELFIPRRTFKEDVTEALLEANQKFWNNANECPPCDVLQCARPHDYQGPLYAPHPDIKKDA